MKYKMLFMALMVLLISIGFCSAHDMNDTELITSEPIGSFSELQDLINGASENSVINLEKDYTFMDSDNLTDGVLILNALTINGNDYVIDGAGKARIFNVAESNVALKNIVFINGYSSDDGGALVINNGEITCCTFKNNSAYGGGAVAAVSSKISDSIFENNSASYGGAILTSNSELSNLILKDNTAHMDGGAIEASYSKLYGLNFINNYADSAGGALSLYNSAVYNSHFENNSADNYGGAIFKSFADVYDCVFVSNFAELGGAIFQDCSYDGYDGPVEIIVNSIFKNNEAEHGGAIFKVGTDVKNCKFENNYAGEGCNNICDNYNHTTENNTNNTDSNDANNAVNNTGNNNPVTNRTNEHSASKEFVAVDDTESKTGNPIVLLLLALTIIIIRIRKP